MAALAMFLRSTCIAFTKAPLWYNAWLDPDEYPPRCLRATVDLVGGSQGLPSGEVCAVGVVPLGENLPLVLASMYRSMTPLPNAAVTALFMFLNFSLRPGTPDTLA